MIEADRPPRRWHHASTRLEHCLRVVYRADPAAVRRAVVPGFEPARFEFDDGSTGALVCAVAFVNRGFAFRALPWLQVSGGQIDYAAYGSMAGERGVWFFGSSLDSRFVLLPRLLWRMPVHADRVRVRARDADRPAGGTRVVVSSTGTWGIASCDVGTGVERAGRVDGFADAEETNDVLAVPTVGWFARRRWRPWQRSVRPAHRHDGDGVADVARFTVWHAGVEAEACVVRHARFSVLEDLGLVDRDAEPHVALHHPHIDFDVHTPPRPQPVG